MTPTMTPTSGPPASPRLGRGLDALLGGTTQLTNGQPGPTTELEPARIQRNPNQPRKHFDEEQIGQMAESIKVHGVLQPLVVRAVGDQFQLIAGERRLRAAQVAGLNTVPVHIVQFNDQQMYEAALVENIQRTDLNPIEKATGFKDYLERFGLTQEQLAQKIGLDRATISNLVGLLNLPKDVQDAVRLGQISTGHAKILKGLNNAELASHYTKQIIMQGLSVQALDTLVKADKAAKAAAAGAEPTTSSKFQKTAHVQGLENELRQKLAVKVEIKVKAEDKGQIVIGFETNDDFERIMEALRK
ncbi:MAG: ParB/RepB/Spo0J family partition protein [Fimbriiglobus sp.]